MTQNIDTDTEKTLYDTENHVDDTEKGTESSIVYTFPI